MKRRTATIISPATKGRFGPNLRRNEQGVVAIIAALMLTAVVGMAALVVDLGWLYVVRGELQNSADTGALAGVVELLLSSSAVAEATAVEYATRPAHFHLTKPAPGAGAVAVTIDDDDDYWLRVRVGPSQVPTIFARVLGIQTSGVSAVAVAELREVIGTGPGNLLPFGIHKDMVETAANNLENNLGSSINVYPDPGNPGNFGLLDFDGGANSSSDTVDWIENGFDGTFVIPESTGFINVEGNTGISGSSLSGAITSRIGDRVLLPVFAEVTGQGANTSFRVVDFVGGIIQSYQLTGNVSERHITVQLVEFASSDLIVSEDDEVEDDDAFNVLAPVLIQ